MFNIIKYQYTMEDIIIKLEDINKVISCVDDNDKAKLDLILTNFIDECNTKINMLSSAILSLTISESKLNSMQRQNIKDRIIHKTLFPYYWVAYESINNV